MKLFLKSIESLPKLSTVRQSTLANTDLPKYIHYGSTRLFAYSADAIPSTRTKLRTAEPAPTAECDGIRRISRQSQQSDRLLRTTLVQVFRISFNRLLLEIAVRLHVDGVQRVPNGIANDSTR